MLIYLQMLESEPEKEKFRKIYDAYRNLMFYVANKILQNEWDAEDAVQQAFLSIVKNLEKISDPVRKKTQLYIVTIVEHKAIDIYQAKKRRPSVSLEEEIHGVALEMPGGGAAAAIARLPARYREFILMKYADGYTNRELAKLLGLSYAGVASLDARAKAAFRKELEKEGIEV